MLYGFFGHKKWIRKASTYVRCNLILSLGRDARPRGRLRRRRVADGLDDLQVDERFRCG